jgi:hypothetical protein
MKTYFSSTLLQTPPPTTSKPAVRKKHSPKESGIFLLRVALACTFLMLSALLGFLAFAADPASGTIGPSGPGLTWSGTAPGVPPTGGAEDACEEGTNCDSFALTLSGTPADWVGKQVHVQINWMLPASDYDLYVHKGGLDGPIVASSGSAGTTLEQVDLNPASSSVGTGQFTVHVVYYVNSGTDQYSGTVDVASAGTPPVPAPTPASGIAPRYENFNPPAAGPATLGRSSGEPSIGIGLPITDHPEGRAMFQSDVQTLRVTFNGACAKPLWENKPAPTSQEDFDPILFTDRVTGRTIVHLLSFVGNVIAGESSYSDTAAPDNDGDIWHPSNGTGIGSGIDHQTVGGGPYRLPMIGTPINPNAVYYCSQALVDASCARSDDGGLNYGPSVVIYSSECGGLHGHVKVGSDGTVYVPNKGCGTEQAVVVSENNGITWNIRKIPGSSSSGSDPAVAVGSAGRVYFGYADGDTKAAIAVSNDRGTTWSQSLDVGATLGINNVVFPAVVAGDDDRAAFAFLGTPTSGGLTGPRFAGIWHLYVATTLDGGATWSTVDATPNDPVQRGCVWLGGGANICRNLLDFMDVQIDQEGRVLVAYADGCAGGECVLAPTSATGNSYTALAAIARQSGGPRLLAAFDPPAAATAPGTPALSAKRNGGVVSLSWSEADNGGSAITGYNVLRSTTSGSEALLTTLPGTQMRYVDSTATDASATYFYKVVATNAQGSSCSDNEVAAKFSGSSYSAPGFTVSSDPTGDQIGAPANADLDVQSLSVSEPGSGPNAGKLVFNLKVADLTTVPNSRMWRVVWNSPNSEFGQFYVGMTKDTTGVVSFEYGTVETQVVGLAVGVPTTHKIGTPDSGAFTPGGLITIAVSNDKVGNPQRGDLLGGFSTRTYATVTDQVRSTNAIDITTNATANDPMANAATYALVGPASARLQNISTRAQVGSNEKVLIGGFIITGSDPKKVIVRGRGPSLMAFGIADPLHDPIIELYNSAAGATPIATNDDWQQTQKTEIEGTGLAPESPLESAIVQTLAPGNYTVILRDKDTSAARLGIVEVFDVAPAANAQLGNLSSRGFVGAGDDVLIGGVIVGPASIGDANVLVRSLGPSLGTFGVANALPDPTIKLFDQNGTQIAANDDWRANEAAIQAQAPTLAPSRDEEAALIATLAPGQYTAIIEGKNATGVATVEVYALVPP